MPSLATQALIGVPPPIAMLGVPSPVAILGVPSPVAILGVPSPVAILGVPLIILFAYTIFGITGFGSSITALPLLAHVVPLRFAVPMMVLFDLGAALLLGMRNRGAIAREEVKRVLPFMFIGIALGATVLVNAPQRWLMLGLGVFVLAYAAWSLLFKPTGPAIRAWWAAPIGALGGIFSALFGTGGPVYAIYLARRLPDKSVLRATVTTVISASGVSRLVVFAVAGLYAGGDVLLAGLALAPSMLAGVYIGNRLHHRLPAQKVVRLIWAILLIGGTSLIARSLSS